MNGHSANCKFLRNILFIFTRRGIRKIYIEPLHVSFFFNGINAAINQNVRQKKKKTKKSQLLNTLIKSK